MTAWWHSLRVLSARRRRQRRSVRRAPLFGVEQLESRRLLAVLPVDVPLDTTAGFVLSGTSLTVSESGNSSAFSVALTAQPSTDVVLSVASGDTSEATVSQASVTFTSSNWNQPQWVMVAGMDDHLVDGDQVTQITVGVDLAASDGSFADVPAQWVTVTTTDNDVAGFTVSRTTAGVSETGSASIFTVVLTAQPDMDVTLTLTSADTGEVTVNPAALTFTPAAWNTLKAVTVTGVDDDWDDGTQFTNVTVSVAAESSDPKFAAVGNRSVIVFTEDDDDAGFVLSKTTASVSENETTDTFTVRLTARPETNVVLTVISADPGEATVSPTVLTFSPADWNLPQTVTVTGVDDQLIDGTVATQVMVSVSDDVSDDKFDAVPHQAVHVSTMDNDVAGFVLSRSGLTVTEAGSSDAFTIVLTAQPNSSVTLSAIGGDAGEATVTPAVLTFAPDEWNVPQTVTVTGVDDHRIDGDQTTFVTVSVADAISDSRFTSVAEQTVSVTTTDDDVAGFTLSKPLAVVSETGTTETFSVVLTAQPELDVTLTVTSSDTGEATVSPATLVFSPGGWDSPRTVTITGANDSSRDGDQSSIVTVAVNAAQSDAQFAGVPAQTVSVTTTDDDQGWQNSDNPFDVSGDGSVDASDVLILINYVNGSSGSPTLPPSSVSPPPYYDVNDDGRCTPFDVLLVINFINNQISSGASSAGEGESESREMPDSNVAPLDSPSEPASVPSVDVQLISAPYERATSNPVSFSTSDVSTVSRIPSGLAGSATTASAVPVPASTAATAFREPIVSAELSRTSEVADDQWIRAVDASLEDWEPSWENPLESPFAA